jgi:hypothetical protein
MDFSSRRKIESTLTFSTEFDLFSVCVRKRESLKMLGHTPLSLMTLSLQPVTKLEKETRGPVHVHRNKFK